MDTETLNKIYNYIYYSTPCEALPISKQSILKWLEEKYASIERRIAFSEYKKSEPKSAGRETARQHYLELSGIPASFVTKKEISNEDMADEYFKANSGLT